MARLDRLAHGKAVAQLGAAIGREFEHEQLSSIADMQPEILGEGLRQLLAAGLVFSRGAAPDATYTFKHALVQDAAYGSMLRQRRQEVHGRIARELVERAAGVRPELIAHHFEAAGKLSEAVEWLETAGDAAVRSAASQEAIRFWRRALQLLSGDIGVKDTPRRQIQLMQKLASTFIQVEGYGSTEAFELGEAALRVANETKNLDLYIRVSTANAPTLFPRQDYERVERQLAHVSERDLQTVGIASQTHYWSVRGITDFHLGRFAESLHNLVRALSLGDAIRNSESSFGGGDVRFVARSYLARAELIFGLRDTATATAEDALVTARQLADPFSIAWGLVTLGRTHLATGKYKKSILALDESVQLCERYGYIARLGQAFTLRGSVKAVLGEAQAGMNEIEKGIELWRRSAGIFSMDILLTEAAHYLSSCGGQELARRLVQDAKRIYEIGPERAAYPECLRLEGVFTALDGNAAAAHKKLREAIKAAEMQAANSYRLRAAYDLARMLVDDGDKRGARNILAPAYSWFTEGFDAPDVVQAKTLLDELTG
jgi:tetratricopeptide (TPR) repeat protein